jgi:hypothetical protein
LTPTVDWVVNHDTVYLVIVVGLFSQMEKVSLLDQAHLEDSLLDIDSNSLTIHTSSSFTD